jgi:hypothetical protein
MVKTLIDGGKRRREKSSSLARCSNSARTKKQFTRETGKQLAAAVLIF